MKTPKLICILGLLILPFLSHSQRAIDDKELLRMVRQAERLWKDEKYIESESLYLKANERQPCYNLMDLAENKMELGDINGGNRIFDKYISTLQSEGLKTRKPSELRDDLETAYSRKANSNFSIGSPTEGLKAALACWELFKNRKPGVSNSIIKNACDVAFAIDDRQSLISINEWSKTMDKNMTGDAKFAEFISGVYLLILQKKFDEAESRLNDVIKNKGGFIGSRDWAELTFPYLYLAEGDYNNLEKSVQVAIDGRPKLLASENVAKKLMSNFFGFIALNKKDYKVAIEQFTLYLNRKGWFNSSITVPDKFTYYTGRAEAYMGLNEMDKARKDFEAALLYNPDYEPALQGLAKLEGKIVANRKTDKSPPEILITEPANRGVITESTGLEIMVKGIAADAGGLSAVTLNGMKVYSQEDGQFWGNVSLKEGINKVIVRATDFSGNSSEKTIEVKSGSSSAVAGTFKEGKNYALLIGCQNYDDASIPSLEDPIPDAVRLKLILKSYYNFGEENIFTLFNPVGNDLKKQFLEIYEKVQPEDNLVIFYAGHGIWVDKEKKGYWLLTDAILKDVNTWIPNKTVLDMLARVPARHTLLITDACFSGSVFRTRGVNTDMPAPIQQLNEKISRVAITSGNDTEVPDKSVFMKYLVKALSENKDKYLTAQKMFINQILEAVMSETKTEPRYGTLELAGHLGGDFIFTRK